MLENSKAFSGFAVKDMAKAKEFYGETLGLEVNVLDEENGLMQLEFANERPTLIYQQPAMTPASYTILNFQVDDIDQAVDELSGHGVTFERYEEFDQDDKGIAREGAGPQIAWFKDPFGNVLSVLQESGPAAAPRSRAWPRRGPR
jgi:catechol 2,3-dioxygenase-like lactoylglutathione lyase family enzyme